MERTMDPTPWPDTRTGHMDADGSESRKRGGDALVRGFQSMGMGGPMITTPGTLTPI
jgi:hypothetical protein